MMEKKYHIFAGQVCSEAVGPMSNYLKSVKTFEDAKNIVLKNDMYDWFEVLQTVDGGSLKLVLQVNNY